METNLHRVFCVTGRGLNGDIEPKKIVYTHRQHNEFKKKEKENHARRKKLSTLILSL